MCATKLTTPPNFDGTWSNELESEMTLTVSGNVLTGTYTSKVSSTATGGGTTPPRPLTGFISGDLISFIVDWGPPYDSLTAWVGQLTEENGTETIKTLWHLVRNVEDEDEPTGLWYSILAGADEFKRK